MTIETMYLEDGVIVMIIEGWPERVFLDNHVDNRRLMKAIDHRNELQQAQVENYTQE
jgi:hypothetical protein